MNKDTLIMGIAPLAVGLAAVIIFSQANSSGLLAGLATKNSGSADAIAKAAVEYLNKSILQQGQTAVLKNASMENGLTKFKIDIAGTEYTSWATPDGKFIFPTAIEVGSNPMPSVQPVPNK